MHPIAIFTNIIWFMLRCNVRFSVFSFWRLGYQLEWLVCNWYTNTSVNEKAKPYPNADRINMRSEFHILKTSFPRGRSKRSFIVCSPIKILLQGRRSSVKWGGSLVGRVRYLVQWWKNSVQWRRVLVHWRSKSIGRWSKLLSREDKIRLDDDDIRFIQEIWLSDEGSRFSTLPLPEYISVIWPGEYDYQSNIETHNKYCKSHKTNCWVNNCHTLQSINAGFGK